MYVGQVRITGLHAFDKVDYCVRYFDSCLLQSKFYQKYIGVLIKRERDNYNRAYLRRAS